MVAPTGGYERSDWPELGVGLATGAMNGALGGSLGTKRLLHESEMRFFVTLIHTLMIFEKKGWF